VGVVIWPVLGVLVVILASGMWEQARKDNKAPDVDPSAKSVAPPKHSDGVEDAE